MSDEKIFIDQTRTVSIRFTPEEMEFINENYELISGTPERITYRDFFFLAIQKAVSRIAPRVAIEPRPEDVKQMETLRAQLAVAEQLMESKQADIDGLRSQLAEASQLLESRQAVIDENGGIQSQLDEANQLLESKQAAIDEITLRNVELDQEVDRLNLLTEQYREQAAVRERESDMREQAMEAASRVKEGTLILEDMQPVETALVMEYARLMQTTPKAVLVEKLFTPTVWHGPGDYIPRLTGAAKRKIRETFQ
jgi:myosin heavy subunit